MLRNLTKKLDTGFQRLTLIGKFYMTFPLAYDVVVIRAGFIHTETHMEI